MTTQRNRRASNILAGRWPSSRPAPGMIVCILCQGEHLKDIHRCGHCGVNVSDVEACFSPSGELVCTPCAIAEEPAETVPDSGLADEIARGPWPPR